MFALASESLLNHVFGRLGYLAPFLLLVGAGAGLPVPEEVTMVGSGFLLHQGRVDFTLIVATCWVATLIGDSIPFWLGRTVGSNVMEHRWIARVVHAERRALLENRFHRHANWAVITCRFLPGVRIPGFFTAGTLRMGYVRFLLCNGLAALVHAPAWILVGRLFGEKIANLEEQVQHLNQILGFAVLATVIGLGVHWAVVRRERQLARLEAKRGEGASDGSPVADLSKRDAS